MSGGGQHPRCPQGAVQRFIDPKTNVPIDFRSVLITPQGMSPAHEEGKKYPVAVYFPGLGEKCDIVLEMAKDWGKIAPEPFVMCAPVRPDGYWWFIDDGRSFGWTQGNFRIEVVERFCAWLAYLAKCPFVEETRMGLFGFSAGAYAVVELISHKSCVPLSGVGLGGVHGHGQKDLEGLALDKRVGATEKFDAFLHRIRRHRGVPFIEATHGITDQESKWSDAQEVLRALTEQQLRLGLPKVAARPLEPECQDKKPSNKTNKLHHNYFQAAFFRKEFLVALFGGRHPPPYVSPTAGDALAGGFSGAGKNVFFQWDLDGTRTSWQQYGWSDHGQIVEMYTKMGGKGSADINISGRMYTFNFDWMQKIDWVTGETWNIRTWVEAKEASTNEPVRRSRSRSPRRDKLSSLIQAATLQQSKLVQQPKQLLSSHMMMPTANVQEPKMPIAPPLQVTAVPRINLSAAPLQAKSHKDSLLEQMASFNSGAAVKIQEPKSAGLSQAGECGTQSSSLKESLLQQMASLRSVPGVLPNGASHSQAWKNGTTASSPSGATLKEKLEALNSLAGKNGTRASSPSGAALEEVAAYDAQQLASIAAAHSQAGSGAALKSTATPLKESLLEQMAALRSGAAPKVQEPNGAAHSQVPLGQLNLAAPPLNGAGGAADKAPSPEAKWPKKLSVRGCSDEQVGKILHGLYTLSSENHDKPVFSKQEGRTTIKMYFWDDRDGEGLQGWWLGPEVGGDNVLAYNATAQDLPPAAGWKRPGNNPGVAWEAEPRMAVALGEV